MCFFSSLKHKTAASGVSHECWDQMFWSYASKQYNEAALRQDPGVIISHRFVARSELYKSFMCNYNILGMSIVTYFVYLRK